MAKATLADGRVIKFPDGLPPDRVRMIIQKASGQSPQVEQSAPMQYSHWATPDEAIDFMLAGAPTKLNAALLGGIDSTVDFVKGKGFNYSGNYNKALDWIRAGQENWREENPVKSAIGKGTGLALGVGLLPGIGTGVKGAIGTGALYGGATGALQDADSMKERAQNTAIGGATGAAMGGLLAGAAKGFNKLRTPNPVSDEQQRLTSILSREGVDLTAGQKTGSENLRYLESELGGSKAAKMMEKQAGQFTAAALKKAGISSNRATPDVIDNAFTGVGKQFDDLAVRNTLVPDVQLSDDLTKIVGEYSDLVGAEAKPVVMKSASNVFDILSNSGQMTGAEFQAASSAIKSSARKVAHPETKIALNDLAHALDDAMERSISKTNPQDLGAFGKVRNQYRNLLVVEQAATGAGQNTAQGFISPSQLRQATLTKHGRRNYAKGKGDYANLARAGEAMMKPLPNSGTAGRTWARNVGASLPATIGTMAGSPFGIPGMLAGGLLGAASPRVAGAGLLSKPVQAYLSRQGGGSISPEVARRLAAEAGLLGGDMLLSSP